MPRIKLWGNRMMSRLISRLAGQTFHDVSCGMRCYSRRAALHLHLLGRFTYTQEVFLNLAFKQMRIVEVPIKVRGEREYGRSRVAGSLWRYALRTAQIIFRCYRDYHPLRFFGGAALLLMLPAFGFGGVPAAVLRADRWIFAIQMDRLRGRAAARAGGRPAPHRSDW